MVHASMPGPSKCWQVAGAASSLSFQIPESKNQLQRQSGQSVAAKITKRKQVTIIMRPAWGTGRPPARRMSVEVVAVGKWVISAVQVLPGLFILCFSLVQDKRLLHKLISHS